MIFKKIRKDLKLYTFEYLNTLDKIHLYFTTSKLRDFTSINKNILYLLKFLLRIEKKDEKIDFANMFNNKNLLNILNVTFGNKFTKLEIMECFSSYLIMVKNKYNCKRIKIILENYENLFSLKSLFVMLKMENFEYHFVGSIIIDQFFSLEEFYNTFSNINYINLSLLNDKIFFGNLIQTGIKFTISEINEKLIKESVEYFRMYTNTLDSLKISNKLNLEPDLINELIQNNKTTLKEIKICDYSLGINKINTLFNSHLINCENLTSIIIYNSESSNCSEHNTDNSICGIYFPQFKKSKNITTFISKELNILSNYVKKNSAYSIRNIGYINIKLKEISNVTKFLNSFVNLESILSMTFDFVDGKNITNFFNNLHLKCLKSIKIVLPCLVDYSDLFLSNLYKFKKLENVNIETFNETSDDYFSINNIVSIPCSQGLTSNELKFILNLVKNNDNVKQYNISCADNLIFSKFINSIYLANEEQIINNVFSVEIKKTYNNLEGERKITKKLNNVNKLVIQSPNDYKSFKNVRKIQSIHLAKIFYDNLEFFEFMKNVKISSIIINEDLDMKCLMYISKNIIHFTNLKYFEVKKTKCDCNMIMSMLKMIELKASNLYFSIPIYKGNKSKLTFEGTPSLSSLKTFTAD